MSSADERRKRDLLDLIHSVLIPMMERFVREEVARAVHDAKMEILTGPIQQQVETRLRSVIRDTLDIKVRLK